MREKRDRLSDMAAQRRWPRSVIVLSTPCHSTWSSTGYGLLPVRGTGVGRKLILGKYKNLFLISVDGKWYHQYVVLLQKTHVRQFQTLTETFKRVFVFCKPQQPREQREMYLPLKLKYTFTLLDWCHMAITKVQNEGKNALCSISKT